MNIFFKITLLILFMSEVSWAQNNYFSAKDIDIPHTKFKLNNGLTLLVHEDHKAPIAAVNVWYHVGSKNEKIGKSGFAHLFEHLMFNGTENYNDDYFKVLEKIGATDLNGTTNNDRTNYFQNIPTAALDQVLFLESDRMGHLLGVIDQARLDEQRGVVQNEKRQGENQPYGKQFDYITWAMFPKGHPYSWTVIGEMEDLNAASLEDVQDWFRTYYGPANAVIAIVGDVNPQEIYEKVNYYFGDIPSGPPLSRMESWVPEHPFNTRQEYQDRVPEARINLVWNTPPYGDKEDIYFDLISSILSNGKNSRLYKKLVYEDQIASSAVSFEWSKELASNFVVQANAKPGQSIEELEAKIHKLLNEFIANGPTLEELNRAKAVYFSDFIKGIERIGGFGGKSDIIASGQTYHGNSNYYKETLQWVEDATIADIKATAQKWLKKYYHTLICTPFPTYSNNSDGADRSKLPALGQPVSASFPNLQKTTLSNGMKVVLAKREGVPTVEVSILFDAGYSSDQFAKPGTASLAMNMMDEGTSTMNSLKINEKLQLLGATLSTGSDLDISQVSMSTLKPTLDPSLDILADVILHPAFPVSELERLKKEQIDQIKREKSQPVSKALRVMTKYMYGEGHAYSNPYTGTGFEADVASMSQKDMKDFYDRWIKSNNATITVVGDINMPELKQKLEKLFSSWKEGAIPKKNLATVKTDKKNVLYFMNRADSEQSVIIAGYLIEPYGQIPQIPLNNMMDVLGGQFISRINMNLREDKGWSYGSFGLIINAKGQRPLMAYAPVQTDKTKEAVDEIRKEMTQIISDKPVTKDEFEGVKNNEVLQLPGQWETNDAVSGSLYNMVKYDLPEDYYKTYDSKVRNLSLSEVNDIAKKAIHPTDMNWFVVGDKAKVIDKLKDAGFSEIIELDEEGNPISEKQKENPKDLPSKPDN